MWACYGSVGNNLELQGIVTILFYPPTYFTFNKQIGCAYHNICVVACSIRINVLCIFVGHIGIGTTFLALSSPHAQL